MGGQGFALSWAVPEAAFPCAQRGHATYSNALSCRYMDWDKGSGAQSPMVKNRLLGYTLRNRKLASHAAFRPEHLVAPLKRTL